MVSGSIPWTSQLEGKTSFLFDLDGTLVDSNRCHEQAFLAALQSDRPDLVSKFDYEVYKGRGTGEVFRHLGIEDERTIGQLTKTKQRVYRDMVEEGQVLALPHVTDVLAHLRVRNRRLFVVTSASRRSAESALTKSGIIEFFEHVVTGDDVSRGKPYPDCYETCIEEARIERDSAIAVEDAESGIHSARAAGLAVLAVHNSALQHVPEYVRSFHELHQALMLLSP